MATASELAVVQVKLSARKERQGKGEERREGEEGEGEGREERGRRIKEDINFERTNTATWQLT